MRESDSQVQVAAGAALQRFPMLLAVLMVAVAGLAVLSWLQPAPANAQAPVQATAAADNEAPPIAVFNITRGPEDLLRVVTALRTAEEALASNRRVILLFSCEGVNVPMKRLPQDLQLGRERPLWRMLQDVVNRGAVVIVPRASMEAVGFVPADFIDGTRIEPWAGEVFSRVNRNTVVFSY